MQHSPVVVPLAVRFAVTHEARAALVQKLRAVRTLEAGGVPLQVRGHAHDVLVVDLRPAANARGCASLLCNVRKQMTVINGVGHVIGTLLKKKKRNPLLIPYLSDVKITQSLLPTVCSGLTPRLLLLPPRPHSTPCTHLYTHPPSSQPPETLDLL